MFLKQMQVGQMAIFAYIIGDPITKEAMVVDPAANTDLIIAEAAKKGFNIRHIVNTHGHVDHISGNADMKQKTGAEIMVHEADADMLVSTPGMILRMFGAKPSPPADVLLHDGDQVKVGEIAFKVLHTPGHTQGGICLYREGHVLTGDTLFVGGVGRTDLPGGSWGQLIRSIQEKLLSLPGETIVLPGHNYGASATSTIGRERRTNMYLK